MYQVILGLGGFFVLLGIVFVFWNRREKNRYYNHILLTRRDIKETITREHEQFWLHAWKIGGWISLAVGTVLVLIGAILWYMAP